MIIDPIIEIDSSNVVVNDLTKEIKSIDVILTTPNGSKFGVQLKNIYIGNITWSEVDLQSLINNELKKYLI